MLPKVRLMKEERLRLGIVKILLAMGMLVTTFITVKADDEFQDKKLNITASEKVSREGETTTIRIDGMSYDYTGTPYHIGSDHQLEISSEYYFKNLEIEKITIPTMIDSDYDQLQISLMLYLKEGKGYAAITKQVKNINEGPIVITRAEIDAWLEENNEGIMPYKWYLYLHPKDSEKTEFNVPTQKMILDGPIEIEYQVTDNSNYFDNALNNWNIIHYYRPHKKVGEYSNGSPRFDWLESNSVTYSIKTGLQSSSIEINDVSQDSVKQDDEVTLDFNLFNESTYNKNNRLNIGIELESDDILELVDNNLDNKFEWVQEGNIFRMHLTDEDGHYANVGPKELVEFSKTFKVKNVVGEVIVIKPFIYNEMDSSKRYYGDEIRINTVLPIQSSTINITYVDQDNNEIKAETVLLGQPGDEYEILVPEIEGYDFINSSIDLKGTFDVLEKQAVLTYKKVEDSDKEDKTSSISVHYHDEKGNVIKDTLVVEGVVGDDYVVDTFEIKGYEFKETSNDLTLKFEEEDIEVILIYTEIKIEKPVIDDNNDDSKSILPNTGVQTSSLLLPACIIIGIGVIIIIVKKKKH